MEKEHLAQVVCESLPAAEKLKRLDGPEPEGKIEDLCKRRKDRLETDGRRFENPVIALMPEPRSVRSAMVGKYIQLHDAYLSVVEALKHGGIAARANVDSKRSAG